MIEVRPSAVFVLAVSLVVGCTQPSNSAPPHDSTADFDPPPASSRARASLEWLSSADAISYLEPETDNVWINLSCESGSGLIRIDHPLRDKPTRTIVLVSGDLVETYPATMGQADHELGLPPGATAQAQSSSSLLRRFRQTGELGYEGGSEMLARTVDERERIEAFFERCG